MSVTQRSYLSYLLRLWREQRDDEVIWRGSLESVQTGERRTFSDAGRLFAFLRERMELAAGAETEE